MSEKVLRGRGAFAEHRWEDAYSDLSAADRASPLAVPDLELLSRAASLTARDDEAFGYLERGYSLCLGEGDDVRAATAAFWIGFRLASRGERGRSQAWLARAEDIVDRHPECVVAGYLDLPRIHHLLHTGDTEAAHASALHAIGIGDRLGDTDLSALARQLGGRALLEHGDIAGGMRLLDEAMLIATSEQISELSKGLVYCAVVGCCQRVFAVDRAREWSDVLDDWCRDQTQLGIFDGTCRVHRAELLQFAGAWDEATAEAEHVASAPRSDVHERAAAQYQLAEVHRLRGENESAEAAYGLASSLGADPQPGLSLLRLAQGRVDVAAGSILRATGTARDELTRATFLPAAVEILVAAGDSTGAAAAADDLMLIAETYTAPHLFALAHHAAGLVALDAADPAAALDAFRIALDYWDALGAPYGSARTRASIGVAFRELGDDDGARLETGAARSNFDLLGAAYDLGAGQATGPDGSLERILSPRELQVLRLAATGETNREIGTRLGLSVRTVDRHMSSILLKLAVPSRAGATAYAYEHGLIGG